MASSSSGKPIRSEQERAKYASAAATLVSATNDPRSDSQISGWWGFKAVDTSWRDPPPPLDTWKYPDVTRADLAHYLSIVGHGRGEQFHQDRISLAEGLKQQKLLEGEGALSRLAAYIWLVLSFPFFMPHHASWANR